MADREMLEDGNGRKPIIEAFAAELEGARDVTVRLLELQVCPCCCLRFAGCWDEAKYSGAVPSAQELLGHLSSGSAAPPIGTTCPLCLGALQSSSPSTPKPQEQAVNGSAAGGSMALLPGWGSAPHVDGGTWHELPHRLGSAISQLVVSAVKEEGHEFAEFQLQLSVPANHLIRERAAKAYLQAQEGTLENVVPLKEVISMQLITALQSSCPGATHREKAGMQVTVALYHPAGAIEASGLIPSPAPQGPGKKRKHWDNRGQQDIAPPKADVHTVLVESCSRRAISEAVDGLSESELRGRCGVPPNAAAGEMTVAVRCMRRAEEGAAGGALLLGGRYRKLQRDLSQSPWLIQGEQKGGGSVQDLIEEFVLPSLRADGCKFVTAGREDIDVRMLGNGRPFILEVFNTRCKMPTAEDTQRLADQLREAGRGVEILHFQPVDSELYLKMREGESEKEKTYCAVIWTSRLITEEDVFLLQRQKDLILKQATPVRVLHRRASMTREKVILHMQCHPITGAGNYAVLKLKASAGTYIKEFVHGDFGRTTPSIGSLLGCQAQILQLDVLDVHLDFL